MYFWCLQFLPKNEQKQGDLRFHSSKVEFVHLFFGRNINLKKSLRLFLTFRSTEELSISSLISQLPWSCVYENDFFSNYSFRLAQLSVGRWCSIIRGHCDQGLLMACMTTQWFLVTTYLLWSKRWVRMCRDNGLILYSCTWQHLI